MATNKQTRARERNWLKARIMSAIIHPSTYAASITQEEANIINSINTLRQNLIDRWEENSTKLGMQPNIKEKKYKRD